MPRCWWVGQDDIYVKYHDNEWGFPVTDDHRLFEKLCLEGFQAGLSWLTILRKRENFREAFHGFDFTRIATYKSKEVERLLKNEGIIRHRGKIESTINNAKHAIKLANEFGTLANYFWRQEMDATPRPKFISKDFLIQQGVPQEATALSKDLKKRGWTFVGPTTVYSFMQAMGLTNDHLSDCDTRASVIKAREKLKKP